MEDARALLNSLMGADRNLDPALRKERKYTDSDFCRNYMMGLCPNELFSNTKIDLGKCKKVHDDDMMKVFEEDPDAAPHRRRWRAELRSELLRLIEVVDRRIATNRMKISAASNSARELTDDQKKLIESMKEEMTGLLKQADEAGDEGRFEDSKTLMKESDALKRKIEDLEAHRYEKYRKEEICQICGVIVDTEEAAAMETGRGWHENGKQHLGYKIIRDHLKVLDEKDKQDKVDDRNSRRPWKDAAAGEANKKHSRSRDRGRRSRSRERRQSREKRGRSREKGKEKDREKERETTKEEEKEKGRDKEKDKEREGHGRSRDKAKRSRSRDRNRGRSKKRSRSKKRRGKMSGSHSSPSAKRKRGKSPSSSSGAAKRSRRKK